MCGLIIDALTDPHKFSQVNGTRRGQRSRLRIDLHIEPSYQDAYPDSYAFKPDRFLTDEGRINCNVRDPSAFAFGVSDTAPRLHDSFMRHPQFGRRICPGRRLAYTSMWLTIASLMKTFDIRKAKRADGSIVEPSKEWVSGLV